MCARWRIIITSTTKLTSPPIHPPPPPPSLPPSLSRPRRNCEVSLMSMFIMIILLLLVGPRRRLLVARSVTLLMWYCPLSQSEKYVSQHTCSRSSPPPSCRCYTFKWLVGSRAKTLCVVHLKDYNRVVLLLVIKIHCLSVHCILYRCRRRRRRSRKRSRWIEEPPFGFWIRATRDLELSALSLLIITISVMQCPCYCIDIDLNCTGREHIDRLSMSAI